MSEDDGGRGLVVALETIKPTGRTRLLERDAVKIPVCNTPKASSVSAGRVERVRYEVEKQIRTWRSWFEGASEDLNYNVVPDAVRPGETWLVSYQAEPKTLYVYTDTDGAAVKLTGKSVCTVERYDSHILDCSAVKQWRIALACREAESHGSVRRLPEAASSWRVRVAPPWIRQWWERVAPPELMGGSSRAVMTSKQTSQILEQIGTGAEVKTTSDSSASRETFTRNQTWKRRYLSINEPWIQEPRRKNEGQKGKHRASHGGQKGKHRASHGGDGDDCGERNDKEGCNELL